MHLVYLGVLPSETSLYIAHLSGLLVEPSLQVYQLLIPRLQLLLVLDHLSIESLDSALLVQLLHDPLGHTVPPVPEVGRLLSLFFLLLVDHYSRGVFVTLQQHPQPFYLPILLSNMCLQVYHPPVGSLVIDE